VASSCKHKDHVFEFASVSRILSDEGSFSNLIAFSKVTDINDPIFCLWKVILKTDAEWHLSRDTDTPRKEA
jgi:hypothetical protein